MVGAQGSRMMRLLKRTSEHHRPARLAAAVALGMLAGMVPKANLLAVVLYAALVLLPVHTLLGLGVSVIFSLVASALDAITGAVGTALLQQQSLRPLWQLIDNSPLLPWLALHNTVVLGNFVAGFALLGPTYVTSLRLFERARWPMPAVARVQAVHELLPQALPKRPATSTIDAAVEEEEIDFEPVREVLPIINAWHMSHTTKVRAPIEPALTQNTAMPPRSSNAPAVGAADICDSIQLAHGAGEVLAWVDQLLDECLAEEGLCQLAIGTNDASRDLLFDAQAGISADASCQPSSAATAVSNSDPAQSLIAQVDVAAAMPEGERQWLMETSIEIVRWTDLRIAREHRFEGPTADRPDATDATSSSVPHPADATAADATAADATTADATAAATAEPGEPNEKEPSSATASSAHAGRLRQSIDRQLDAGARRLAVSESSIVSSMGSSTEPSTGPSIEPPQRYSVTGEQQRNECLGFLLGHLRQARDGRPS